MFFRRKQNHNSLEEKVSTLEAQVQQLRKSVWEIQNKPYKAGSRIPKDYTYAGLLVVKYEINYYAGVFNYLYTLFDGKELHSVWDTAIRKIK